MHDRTKKRQTIEARAAKPTDTLRALAETVTTLPADRQSQVLDFARFLSGQEANEERALADWLKLAVEHANPPFPADEWDDVLPPAKTSRRRATR